MQETYFKNIAFVHEGGGWNVLTFHIYLLGKDFMIVVPSMAVVCGVWKTKSNRVGSTILFITINMYTIMQNIQILTFLYIAYNIEKHAQYYFLYNRNTSWITKIC